MCALGLSRGTAVEVVAGSFKEVMSDQKCRSGTNIGGASCMETNRCRKLPKKDFTL